ncbi:hypothetical protein HAX54_001961 [Datura stramonium]|uniref:Uncharacterized protein n=1 Tax=Datura stramonium TaxID=4076 RepID=A0ABS8T5E2_DATST|nr:hypothetical protein [Datura stramonium]
MLLEDKKGYNPGIDLMLPNPMVALISIMVVVDDVSRVSKQAGLTVPPVQVHESPPRDCTLNSILVLSDDTNDDYKVIHYEDDFDQDTKFVGAQEEDDEEDEESSEHLIKAFGPTIDSNLHKEI